MEVKTSPTHSVSPPPGSTSFCGSGQLANRVIIWIKRWADEMSGSLAAVCLPGWRVKGWRGFTEPLPSLIYLNATQKPLADGFTRHACCAGLRVRTSSPLPMDPETSSRRRCERSTSVKPPGTELTSCHWRSIPVFWAKCQFQLRTRSSGESPHCDSKSSEDELELHFPHFIQVSAGAGIHVGNLQVVSTVLMTEHSHFLGHTLFKPWIASSPSKP